MFTYLLVFVVVVVVVFACITLGPWFPNSELWFPGFRVSLVISSPASQQQQKQVNKSLFVLAVNLHVFPYKLSN